MDSRENLINENSITSLPNKSCSKVFCMFANFISIACFGIKCYILYRFWIAFLPADLKMYVFIIEKNDFYRTIISFINICTAWIGMILISLEAPFQLCIRFLLFTEKLSFAYKLNFIQLNCFTFAFLHGFFPEISFIINNIDLRFDENFFIDVYKFKTWMELLIIMIMLVCFGCAVFAVCCGQGKRIGTWQRTRIYANGRQSFSEEAAYAPDWKSGSLFCLSGMSMGVVLVIAVLVFLPMVVGITCYVYNLSYMFDYFLQTLYITELCFSILHVYFYTLVYA